jgi:hypothetical protein
MALTDKEAPTKLEKWLLRLGVIGTAVWQFIQYMLAHWAAKPPQL